MPAASWAKCFCCHPCWHCSSLPTCSSSPWPLPFPSVSSYPCPHHLWQRAAYWRSPSAQARSPCHPVDCQLRQSWHPQHLPSWGSPCWASHLFQPCVCQSCKPQSGFSWPSTWHIHFHQQTRRTLGLWVTCETSLFLLSACSWLQPFHICPPAASMCWTSPCLPSHQFSHRPAWPPCSSWQWTLHQGWRTSAACASSPGFQFLWWLPCRSSQLQPSAYSSQTSSTGSGPHLQGVWQGPCQSPWLSRAWHPAAAGVSSGFWMWLCVQLHHQWAFLPPPLPHHCLSQLPSAFPSKFPSSQSVLLASWTLPPLSLLLLASWPLCFPPWS